MDNTQIGGVKACWLKGPLPVVDSRNCLRKQTNELVGMLYEPV
jgi:hypothetical protein